MNPRVDEFLDELPRWREEMNFLRTIALDCMLSEEFKWKQPCYTFKKKNIIIIGGFKDYCVLLFFKGALLSDSKNILIAPGEHSQSGRQIRFTSTRQIAELEPVLKEYIFEAIEVEKAGLKVEFKKTEAFDVPAEFQRKLDENPALKTAFASLTPGRQRAYLLYFSSAKQSKTREARVVNYEERILRGKGMNDCICGLSRRFPHCDGSHKHTAK